MSESLQIQSGIPFLLESDTAGSFPPTSGMIRQRAIHSDEARSTSTGTDPVECQKTRWMKSSK